MIEFIYLYDTYIRYSIFLIELSHPTSSAVRTFRCHPGVYTL